MPPRPTVTVIGRRLSPEHHRLRDFLTRTAQPFEWVEAATPVADDLLVRHGASDNELPVLIEQDGQVLVSATVDSVAKAWTVSEGPSRSDYDLAIVGAGPAGLGAAVYAASDGLSTVVIEEDVPGGQASHASMIENFFGFPEGIGGAELARLAGRQAERFGAELIFLQGVVGGEHEPDAGFALELAGGDRLHAQGVIAAPGMVWRRLDVPGVEELRDRGVYYGAGRSEAAQCADDDVIVVGAGNSAGQAVMYLAGAGARVTMIVRGDALERSMSGYLVDRIAAHPRVEVRLRTEVDAVESREDWLAGVVVRDAEGRRDRLDARVMFLCLGGVPRTGWADANRVLLDPAGFILTGPDLLTDGARPDGWPLDRDPLALETSIPGLFAAGDARHGSIKRVAGAVGEGAAAVALLHRRLDELLRAVPS